MKKIGGEQGRGRKLVWQDGMEGEEEEEEALRNGPNVESKTPGSGSSEKRVPRVSMDDFFLGGERKSSASMSTA